MARICRWWILLALAAAGGALAQVVPAEAPKPTEMAAPAAQPSSERKWLECGKLWKWVDVQCEGLKDAWYDGQPTLYLSGYTWHDPNTYDEAKLGTFNDRAWGGGYGWAKTAPNGDNYSWYGLIFRDSHYQYTKAAGWAWMTYWPDKADVSAGLGYTIFLASRPDIASNFPFPAILPLASVKMYGVEVLGTFIPKLNGGVNHGNVGYFFARYQF